MSNISDTTLAWEQTLIEVQGMKLTKNHPLLAELWLIVKF